MKEIQAEGTRYIYFTRTDGIPAATVMGLDVKGIDPFMRQHLAESEDVRLVLIPSPLWPDAAYVYYLHWDDGRDLVALDHKVEEGTYTDEDFRHAAKTLYQKTVCDDCHEDWDTLVMPTGDPYLGAPGLEDVKIREHAVISRCPNCGAFFRQLVVKIFEASGARR